MRFFRKRSDGSGFRRAASLAALGLGTLGCGHPVQSKLEGRWFGERVENVDESDIAVVTGWAKGTSMEFSGSSITVTIPAEEPRRGRYKVERAHGGDVVLAVRRGEDETYRTKVSLEDGHLLRWHVGGGKSILMRREDAFRAN